MYAVPDIAALPRRSASQVKNDWGDVRRTITEAGSVAVTLHNEVELVVVTADTYRAMKELADAAQARHDESLNALTAEFDRMLAGMQAADTRGKVEAMMGARGKTVKRPRAGEGF